MALCAAGNPRHTRRQKAVRQHEHQTGPEISLLAPELQEQWDHAANAHFGNIVIRPQSNRQVMWKCHQCPDGHLHQWRAPVDRRTKGSGCPQCTGKKVCKHSSLATKVPKIADDWDYKANAELGTPHTVMSMSNQAAGWLCHDCGHSWTAAISDRVQKKTGCPKCGPGHSMRGLHSRRPAFTDSQHPVLTQWDHVRNAAQGNFPHNTTEGSGKQIYWLCLNCPAQQEHSWTAVPGRRTGKHPSGCPSCAGQLACKCNSLEALYPDRAAEWDYGKNTGRPSDYTAGSAHQAWWQTPERGSWQQAIFERTVLADRTRASAQLGRERTRF